MANSWSGKTAVCIASGPSLHLDDLELIRQAQSEGRCKVIVINTSYLKAMFADVLYAGDLCWWRHYTGEIKKGKWKPFEGEKWTTSKAASVRYGLKHVNGWHGHGHGLSIEAGRINLGGNSGFATVGLAHEFGARRILLTGYDMQRTGGKSHHHGDHPAPLQNGNCFPTWIRRFDRLARDASKAGLEIVNCTRESALTCFTRAPLEVALNGEVCDERRTEAVANCAG